MTRSSVQRRRAIAARLLPLLAVLGALPLMAPTCGSSTSEGYKVFSQRSLVIPMDVCYQSMTDGTGQTYTPAGGTTECPTRDTGDVIRAYGLVYQLIRNGIAVYWVIEQNRDLTTQTTARTTVDLTIQYNGGAPVLLYDWNTGGQAGAPTTNPLINYRGGPFVVDGSDYARASQVMQQYKSAFGAVNVHVSNVAFKGYAKRTMAGGWSAGGTIAPKLALLDIGSDGGSSTGKNSEVVIRGYLTRAGLDTAGAAGTAAGPHGEIFDRLFMPDFVSTSGLYADTNLARNGYQILWVPHWFAPSSCSDCPPSTSCTCDVKYDAATIQQALRNMGTFVAQGNDVFAECAGLGSFEGIVGLTGTTNAAFGTGIDPDTHFQEETRLNCSGASCGATGLGGAWYDSPSFASPLMQLGDYQFKPQTGAIQRFKPYTAPYRTGVQTLIKDASATDWDIYTLLPRQGARGSVVYLGGHSYSGTDGTFQIAGSRLVLNTLFNLGATCTATGVSCSTGLAGVCSAGTYECRNGQPVCVPNVQPGSRAETCNGLDDDCDWEVDEGLQLECYEPPPGYVDPDGRSTTAFAASKNQGVCRPGISVCQFVNGAYQMSACTGQVLPAAESCNGLDDDCDGTPDDGIPAQACYDGPPASIVNGTPIGECRIGSQVCRNGVWGNVVEAGFDPGGCGSQVLPKAEACNNGKDDNCNGQTDENCGCTPSQTQTCFTGPGNPAYGICQPGTQTCNGSGTWDPCPTGPAGSPPGTQVVADLSTPEPCVATSAYVASADLNCDGRTVECPECDAQGVSTTCYGPDPANVPAYAGVGQCAYGEKICSANGSWGACSGYVLPSTIEYCDGQDNDCDGTPDEGAICPSGFACLDGVCVPSQCGMEIPPPEGYDCNPPNLVKGTCGAEVCGTGELCQYGACIDPCPVSSTGESLNCGAGTTCGGGACIGGGCYETGCTGGEVCRDGTCGPSACAGVSCPTGTFCREGDCVQACTFVSCFSGQKCGIDGFCEPDPCAGRTCGPGQACNASGACAPDPCLGKGCAAGQICDGSSGEAICVDDPCTDVVCPAGVCVRGQCFPSGNLTGAGAAPPDAGSSGCGCGSGAGAALPALLALLAAPLLRRGRGRGPTPPRGTGLAVLLVAAALVASGCKEDKADEFDASVCEETCGEQRCVDLRTDPSHCGGCETPCAAGQQCVDRACGPGSAVAPYIRTLTPSSGAKDDPSVVVDVAGERIQQGATVRISTPGGTRTFTCTTTAGAACEWISTGAVRVRVDLSGAPESPWKFRLVNPDRVISNEVPFPIVVPVPAIASIAPSSVPAGTTATIVVTGTGGAGTGFTTGSQCRLEGNGVNDVGLPSALVAEKLECFLDASMLAPGSYQLSVMSEKLVRSNRVTLTLAASDPVVYGVVPSNGNPGEVVTFTVTGARFDATSRVFFDAVQVPTTVFFNTGTLSVQNYALPGAAALYPITVRNSVGNVSNSVQFAVGTNPPQIDSFDPSAAYQGEPTVLMTFAGQNLPSGSVIEVQRPGSSTFTAVIPSTVFPGSCTNACTRVTASMSLVQSPGVPEPDGTWYAHLRYGPAGSPTSAPWPLRVLSNQAILRGYFATPDPKQSGTVGSTKTKLTFQVANIRGPRFQDVRVRFWDPSNASSAILVAERIPSPEPTAATTTLEVPSGLSLAGLLPGTYTFTVHNPNASDSNALPFTVNPGMPTLQKVCVFGTNCDRDVQQGPSLVTVTLTGTNFAKPDANGNGSNVMVTADFMAGFPTPDPCVANTAVQWEPVAASSIAVTSSTEIVLTFDPNAAYADPVYGTTYYVGVWNPGGTSGPQKSSCGVDPRTLPSWFKILP